MLILFAMYVACAFEGHMLILFAMYVAYLAAMYQWFFVKPDDISIVLVKVFMSPIAALSLCMRFGAPTRLIKTAFGAAALVVMPSMMRKFEPLVFLLHHLNLAYVSQQDHNGVFNRFVKSSNSINAHPSPPSMFQSLHFGHGNRSHSLCFGSRMFHP
jgi:hypothetical protein